MIEIIGILKILVTILFGLYLIRAWAIINRAAEDVVKRDKK
jgi:hypothetical protein